MREGSNFVDSERISEIGNSAESYSLADSDRLKRGSRYCVVFNDATSKLALIPENLWDILVTYLKFTKKFAHCILNREGGGGGGFNSTFCPGSATTLCFLVVSLREKKKPLK